VTAPLASVRTGRYEDLALFVAFVAGVVVTVVHPVGLAVGGVLVGAVAASRRRAVSSGLAFGVWVLVVHGGWVTAQGGRWPPWQSLVEPVAAPPLAFAVAVAATFAVPAVVALVVRAAR
jgi:hypothetical protein